MKFDTISNTDPHRPDRPIVAASAPSGLCANASADFSIRVEQPGDLIRIEMGGFFNQQDIRALQHTFETHLASLSCAPNEHRTLCDVRAMKIQAQDIVASFSRMVNQPHMRSKRLAFVTGSSLAQMQVRRLTDRPGVAFFRDVVSAKAWVRAAL